MKVRRIVCVVSLLAGACLVAAPAKAAPKFSDEAVRRAMARGVGYLFSQQRSDGQWLPYHSAKHVNALGPTALATYALLESGPTAQHPRIIKALNALVRHSSDGTYTLACRANAYRAANWQTRGKYYKQLQADAAKLWLGQVSGAYNYKALPGEASARSDNSNSQFGLLGVWAAQQDGREVPISYWNAVIKHWERTQRPDGGWGYGGRGGYNKGASMATLTAGGVASLFVCFDNIHAGRFIKCERKMDYKPILRGLAWLDKNFVRTMGSVARDRWGFYYMYGVERVGLAAGYKYFGKQDWYKTGAMKLIASQKSNGSWYPPPPPKPKPKSKSQKPKPKPPPSCPPAVYDTSFALLFLARGRHPVLFNKLEFDGDWNNRPRDLALLTRWISRTFEKPVNWQIVNLNVPVRELQDAPILYISGAKAPKFTDKQLNKLREFVLQGGCLFSVTECEGEGFREGIRKVYAKLFPRYELVPLGGGHEVYGMSFDLAGVPEISILSNGVRPLAVHCDVDLSRSWQLQNLSTEKYAFKIMANLSLYLTDYSALRPRGTSPWPEPVTAKTTRTVKVIRLKHNGNCDPEPLAWRRFALMMAAQAKTAVKVAGPAPIADLAGTDATIAVMTGTGEFTLTREDRKAILDFVTAGGTLVIDAAGGPELRRDPATHFNMVAGFAAAAERAIEDIFGAGSLRRLSSTSRVYKLPGMEIAKVGYRLKARKRFGGSGEPNLRAVLVDGRPGVIYSREDLTGGLLGCTAFTVDGYTPASAFQLMRNIVLSAGK